MGGSDTQDVTKRLRMMLVNNGEATREILDVGPIEANNDGLGADQSWRELTRWIDGGTCGIQRVIEPLAEN